MKEKIVNAIRKFLYLFLEPSVQQIIMERDFYKNMNKVMVEEITTMRKEMDEAYDRMRRFII
jgi:hypothetical protein